MRLIKRMLGKLGASRAIKENMLAQQELTDTYWRFIDE